MIQHKSEPELRFTFKELAPRLNGTGGPVVRVAANVSPTGVGGAYAAAHRRRGGGPGHRQGGHPALHRAPGRRHRHPPQSYVEGPDPGRRGAGHRLGAQRGVLRVNDGNAQYAELHASWTTGCPPALDLPMIDTVVVEVAQPRASLRRARRGRGAHRPAHGRHRQRHPRRRGRPHGPPPHVPRRGAGSIVGEKRLIAPFGRISMPVGAHGCAPLLVEGTTFIGETANGVAGRAGVPVAGLSGIC